MLKPRIFLSARTTHLSPLFLLPSLHRPLHPPPTLLPPNTRPASHATQGRANKAAQGPGKRLGAKRGDTELVVPGNIIFRQRGTHWFAGENCGMGRDHTIFALAKGYVRYYRDPALHAERKYIGVVFHREEVLPRGRGAARKRRLGMDARVRSEEEVREDVRQMRVVEKTLRTGELPPKEPLSLRPGYMYRESNFEIGRSAQRAKVRVREFKAGDRFLAWRKTTARRAKNAEKKGLLSKRKSKSKSK